MIRAQRGDPEAPTFIQITARANDSRTGEERG